MEALSVTANIVAVLQAANTIISICCDYSAAIKGASWELPKVTKEIRSLRDVLELLAALAKKAENADLNADARLPALIRMCSSDAGPLAMCNAELVSLKTRLEPPKWTGPATSKRTALMQTLTWPLKEGETKKILQNMERYKTMLNIALEVDQTIVERMLVLMVAYESNRAMTLDIYNMSRVIQVKTSELSKDFSTLKQAFPMAKPDDFLRRWLSAPDPSSNHKEACAKRQATTGDWFIRSRNFAKWKKDRNSLLWLHGIPGCGKTILCSTVIENVLLESRPVVSKAVAYFYFDFRKTEDQHEGMMRSLINQLAAQSTNHSHALNSLHSSCEKAARQPRVSDLRETLRDMVQIYDDTFIIIDALDECKEREQLLGDIKNFVKWQLRGLHILVTSRREGDIKVALDPWVNENQNIDMQSEVVDRDIRVYVRKILQSTQGLRRWRNKSLVQDEIEKALTENANGMFRWVVCQIDELKKCLNLPMLRKQLKSLPATLPQTYERILLNIEQNYSCYALKVLQWLTYSRDPLSLLQLAEVVAIDKEEDPRFDPERRFPEPEDILLICSSLITVTEEEDEVWNGAFHEWEIVRTSTVKLAHFSVKEYLLSSHIINGPARKYSIQEIDANVCIAKDCLSYMLYFTEDIRKPARHEENRRFLLAYPLALYAMREWQKHAQVGGQSDEESMVDCIMELFTLEGNAFCTWLFLDLLGPRPHKQSEQPLYYASRMGFLGVARRLMTIGVDVNARSGHYGNALCVASSQGHTEIVKLLLENGADPNSGRHGRNYGSAVYQASLYGYDTIVKLLVAAGAMVGLEEHTSYVSALHGAVSHGNTSIVAMLISSGMDVNLNAGKPMDSKNTALGLAAMRGYDKVVKGLVEAGANPDSKIAALHIASGWGHDEVVKVLLGAGAELNQGWQRASPLREAVESCHLTTVKVLLDAGADVNLGGSWNRGFFDSCARLWSSPEVIDLLAAAGAEIICEGKMIRSGQEMMKQLNDDMSSNTRLRPFTTI